MFPRKKQELLVSASRHFESHPADLLGRAASSILSDGFEAWDRMKHQKQELAVKLYVNVNIYIYMNRLLCWSHPAKLVQVYFYIIHRHWKTKSSCLTGVLRTWSTTSFWNHMAWESKPSSPVALFGIVLIPHRHVVQVLRRRINQDLAVHASRHLNKTRLEIASAWCRSNSHQNTIFQRQAIYGFVLKTGVSQNAMVNDLQNTENCRSLGCKSPIFRHTYHATCPTYPLVVNCWVD